MTIRVMMTLDLRKATADARTKFEKEMSERNWTCLLYTSRCV